jgi:hypothetical protein
MPLIYAKQSKLQSPQVDIDTTEEPPSPLLAEPSSVAKQDRASLAEYARRNPADALLGLQSPEQHVLYWRGLRYVRFLCPDLTALCEAALSKRSKQTTQSSAQQSGPFFSSGLECA